MCDVAATLHCFIIIWIGHVHVQVWRTPIARMLGYDTYIKVFYAQVVVIYITLLAIALLTMVMRCVLDVFNKVSGSMHSVMELKPHSRALWRYL